MTDFTRIFTAEGLYDIECEKCGERMDAEEISIQAGHEPFNGYIHQCECGKEYDVVVGYRVTPINDD